MNVPRIKRFSDGNRSELDIVAKILREPEGQLIIMMPENKFAAKFDDGDEPMEFNYIVPSVTWDAMLWRGTCFEGRKRRPQERWRKKRKKGKRNPIELFFLKGSQARGDCA
jgi:hypothetical protein